MARKNKNKNKGKEKGNDQDNILKLLDLLSKLPKNEPEIYGYIITFEPTDSTSSGSYQDINW